MSSPIDLSGLPVATSLSPSDIMLVRKGLTDYQIAVSVVQSINITSSVLQPLPTGSALQNDLMLISRGGQNYNIRFNQVGLMKGTKCWFYQAAAPLGWTIVTGLGDRLLAVAEKNPPGKADKPYSAKYPGSSGGTWTQEGVNGGTPGDGLSLKQIPNHNHFAKFGSNQSNSKNQYIHGAQSTADVEEFGIQPKVNPIRGMVGGKGDNATHDNYGQCDPHNHGKTWRPLANVGMICSKDN